MLNSILKSIETPPLERINESDFFDDFDQRNKTIIDHLSSMYYVLSNNIITHIYSVIEKDSTFKETKNEEVFLTDIFNLKFYTLLKRMGSEVFKGGELFIFDNIKDTTTKTKYNKFRLQTFVIQCLHNSMKKHLKSKITTVTITDKEINISNTFDSIQANFIIKHLGKKRVTNLKEQFEIIKPSIAKLQTEEYSCTTLTSIQGYVNSVRGAKCDFGFIEEETFFVNITI